MSTREEILSGFYGQYDEDGRLGRSRHGQLEFFTTMNYIRRCAKEGSKVLEIGAGTGRYSIALAKEGYDMTAVELVESNLNVLRENGKGLSNLRSFKGDALELSMLRDGEFDLTLVFGPLYHLYEAEEVDRAIDEAIRVTKKGGVMIFAFLSIYAIMYSNYMFGNWAAGQEENFTEDLQVRHFKEQLFTGYDIGEFERLFEGKQVKLLATAGTDGMLEPLERREDFAFSDGDFEAFENWYLAVCEKRELLGASSHLICVFRKN